ncbi:hypothetical protein MRB53_041490 [Persea americana]|nr:hypothetical protein MRB53_041490 [Persea americana]
MMAPRPAGRRGGDGCEVGGGDGLTKATHAAKQAIGVEAGLTGAAGRDEEHEEDGRDETHGQDEAHEHRQHRQHRQREQHGAPSRAGSIWNSTACGTSARHAGTGPAITCMRCFRHRVRPVQSLIMPAVSDRSPQVDAPRRW